jgi:hypothetical protein
VWEGTDDASRRRETERLTLTIEHGPDGDVEELAHLTRQLRRELLELDVEQADVVRHGELPRGAKAVDPAAAGHIALTLAPAAIHGVIALVRRWLEIRRVASVKVTLGEDSLELTNASSEQQDQITRAFLARHPAE